MELSPEIRQRLLEFQRNEITEHHIYMNLSKIVRPEHNREVLRQIAEDELRHYHGWKELTGEDVKPDPFQVWKYTWISRLFGFTFGVKLMERGEENAQHNYHELVGKVEGIEAYIHDENAHEERLIGMLDEELLQYAGSVVLGLNDALVELTGALAGLTLALQNTQLIALSGSITGIAAALSMAASEYLSTKSEKDERKNPVKAAIYTGLAYIVTVLILILPYLLLKNYFVCLALSLTAAIGIIALFNYYISIAKDEPFKARFGEMAVLSLSVAAFSFLTGFLIRTLFGIEV